MKKHQLVALVLLAAVSAAGGDYFVSPGGSDANPGTLDRPFATLQRSQQSAREARGSEPTTVFLRKGTYYLPDTLRFTSEDSGTKAAPVTYQAYRDEEAIISGGLLLARLAWEPYRGGIVKATVPAGFSTDQLFVNGERQPLARYPNFDPAASHFNGFAADALSPERVARWADPQGGFIHAMHSAEWGGMHYLITGKGTDNALLYQGGWQNNRPSGMHPQYRMVENIFEELDAPGEWFLDRASSTLYFYPPQGVDLPTATVEAVRLRHLVEFRGSSETPVRFVSLRGITFRHAARTFMENKEPLVRSDWTTYRGGALFYTGTEDCVIEDCFIDQVGGNAVFVNGFNRRLAVRGCHIARAGGNGVAFVGDRDAARVPRDWNDHSQKLSNLDRTPGPRTADYPGDCVVEDCLIYLSGRVEKQTAPVQIELSEGIRVRHCSLYDVPRAGVNIGDGCWGGHVIEFCDIFDTVKETGDHGSFNSWGRDRFWSLEGLDLNDDATWEKEKGLPMLDAVRTVVLRNNRWRCDHGWDIDLDDGSSNYELRNNLCLNGGIKNREGFYRVVENNIIVNSGFHPHVWYKHSQDVVRHNIMWSDAYLPAGGMPSTPWGKEMDYNLVHRPGAGEAKPARKLAEQSKRDAHSIVADAMFVDAPKGDFRVKAGSPALGLGFVNFAMDQFGVQRPSLKAIARTPEMPSLGSPGTDTVAQPVPTRLVRLWGAEVRNISGLGDRSAYGLPGESGVLVVTVPRGTDAMKAGLRKDDVVLECNGTPVPTIRKLLELQRGAAGGQLVLEVVRRQGPLSITIADYALVTSELVAFGELKDLALASGAEGLPATVLARNPGTVNEPLAVLTDGLIARNYGPVFPNGIIDGAYKVDLGSVRSVEEVRSFSFNEGGVRGRQHFVLYGSDAATDPGWDVAHSQAFVPIIEVESPRSPATDLVATSVRRSTGKPLGAYRWLVWAIIPVTSTAGGENTAFQEFQVMGAQAR